jgi:hypothetical protein
MNTTAPLYIAETDEAGRVNCVWYAAGKRSATRPIRNPNRHLPLLHNAHFAGASLQEIQDWLTQNANTAIE